MVNTIDNEIFNDTERKTIGVAACDIDKDGWGSFFLNTDTYGEIKIFRRTVIKTKKFLIYLK